MRTTKGAGLDKGYSPPPTHFPSGVEIMVKTFDNNGIGVSQQLVNIDSKIIQHPDTVGQTQNSYKLDIKINTASPKISQHFTVQKREREGVKSSPPNGVLQTPVRGGNKVRGKLSLLPSLLAQIGRLM